MILKTRTGTSVDTENDLTPGERHILQKLLVWEAMASSPEEFRRKKDEAFKRGWNQSGPLREREIMESITTDMEEKVIRRLSEIPNK
jgi:hypothetical protein